MLIPYTITRAHRELGRWNTHGVPLALESHPTDTNAPPVLRADTPPDTRVDPQLLTEFLSTVYGVLILINKVFFRDTSGHVYELRTPASYAQTVRSTSFLPFLSPYYRPHFNAPPSNV